MRAHVTLVLALVWPSATFAKSIVVRTNPPREHYCWKLNEETHDWVKLESEVKFAAGEVERLFHVKRKDEGWECQAYYLFEAYKKLTSDEQIKAQENAGEITFNASTGFPITGWWASKGVSLSDGGFGKDAVFSFIAPPSEESQKNDYIHGQYVTQDVLEYYLLSLAYQSDKPIPTNSKERLALLKDIQKKREGSRTQNENKIDRAKSRVAAVTREVAAARRDGNYGALCNDACLPTAGKPCAGDWVKQYRGWKTAGQGQVFCELLFDQGALDKKDTPIGCADKIKACPTNDGKLRVEAAKKVVTRYENDLKNLDTDLDNLDERIEALQSEVRGQKTGDSRKSTDRRVKPGGEDAGSETGKPAEGTPAE